MKTFIVSIVAFVFSVYLFEVPGIIDENADSPPTDSKGFGNLGSDSTGLFISHDGLRATYYRQGKKHGPFRAYYRKTGRLSCFGNYEGNEMVGDWYYFDENDLLFMSEQDVQLNDTLSARNGDGSILQPRIRSYGRLFWPNGMLRMEGICLYDESVEIDFWRYGSWLYYDSLGTLQHLRVYHPGQFVND